MSVRVPLMLTLAIAAGSTACPAAAQDIAPRAITPTTVSDLDYPLAALVANEQGRTGLNLAISPTGAVSNAQIAASSGSARLDEAAAWIAKMHWRFQPATRNGQPVTGNARVDVTWTSPLQPATQAYIDVPATPAGVQMAQPAAARIGRPGDYPGVSYIAGEQGVAGVRYAVNADGSVGQAQLAASSGYPRLDAAALRLVNSGWSFRPATQNGNPVQSWRGVTVAYVVLPWNSTSARPRCYAQPILARESILVGAEPYRVDVSYLSLKWHTNWQTRSIESWVALWVNTNAGGNVTGALIETRGGWMRLPPALTETFTANRTYPQNACWFYDAVSITG